MHQDKVAVLPPWHQYIWELQHYSKTDTLNVLTGNINSSLVTLSHVILPFIISTSKVIHNILNLVSIAQH